MTSKFKALFILVILYSILIAGGCGQRQVKNVVYMPKSAFVSYGKARGLPVRDIPDDFECYGDKIKIWCKPEWQPKAEEVQKLLLENFKYIKKNSCVDLLQYTEPQLIFFDANNLPDWFAEKDDREYFSTQWQVENKNGKQCFPVPLFYDSGKHENFKEYIIREKTELGTMIHEITHVYLYQAKINPNLRCGWFEEGLCEFTEALFDYKRLMQTKDLSKSNPVRTVTINPSAISHFADTEIDLFSWRNNRIWRGWALQRLSDSSYLSKLSPLYQASPGTFLVTPEAGKLETFLNEVFSLARKQRIYKRDIFKIYKQVYGVSLPDFRARFSRLPNSSTIVPKLKSKNVTQWFCFDFQEIENDRIGKDASFNHEYLVSIEPVVGIGGFYDLLLAHGLRTKQKEYVFYGISYSDKKGYIGKTDYSTNEFSLEEIPYDQVMKVYEFFNEVQQ